MGETGAVEVGRRGGGIADARAGLVLLAIGVVFVTLYPFGFVRTSGVYAHQLGRALGDPFDLYLPVHALPAMAGVWLVSAGWSWKRRWTPAVVVGAGLLALELVQAGVAHRHARAGDVVVQWLGAAGGVWAWPMVARVAQGLARWTPMVWAVLLAAWVAAGCVVVMRGQAGHTIGGWDESFPFLLGAEYGGERRWSGVIHSAGVLSFKPSEYTQELHHEWAELLTKYPITTETGIGMRDSAGLIYDLTQGSQSQGDIDFDLRTQDIVYSERGLDLDEGQYAQGQRPASEITRAIVEAGGAMIEVECTPSRTEQTGPARLVTISKGLEYRNLTLGQEGDAAVLRVRTPRAGANGADMVIEWPGVFEAGKRVHLIVTTTGGRSRLWVNGVDRGERESVSRLGDWLKIRSMGKSWIAGAALLVPIGVIAGRLGRSVATRGVIAGVGGGCVVGAALGFAQMEGRTLPMDVVRVALVCVPMGLVVVWALERGSAKRMREV